MLNPRVHTSAGRSRFAPSAQTPRSLLPPPAPLRAASECGSTKVRVIARIRPFLPSEIQESHGKHAPCVSFFKDSTEDTTLHIKDSVTSREGYYKVDSCYGEDDEISGIFAKEVEPLLPALFDGKNATVFAYGATGSGKTYTMQGSELHPGLMHLAMSRILALSEKTNFEVAVAYYEVYMDRCYDLLESKGVEISVFEGSDGKIQLRGLSQVCVRNLEEFKEVFVNGCLRRRVGQTGLNDTSSRSHGVLMVTIASQDNMVCGKLNLIDLAGNEDNRRTGSEGVRLAESARINQDLFTLSNVISALSSNESRVPYRDSKLTRILQDSLGGTSRAIMIVCLNPRSYAEAAHTLIIAARTRQITNQNAERKQDPPSKVDMGSKLQLWLEAKGKISSAPSPAKAKPLFYTPSHHQMNQFRRMARNLPPDTPKARRVLVLHQPNCGLEQEKGEEDTQASPLQSAVDKNLTLNTPSNSKPLTPSLGSIVKTEAGVHYDEPKDKGADQYPSKSFELNKENLCNMMDFTPSLKALSKPSSPPLSVRLQKLRVAMKEILHPNCDSGPTKIMAEIKPSAGAIVKASPPGFSHVNSSSSFKSPVKTPLPLLSLEDESTGTPLEKLSKKSSGIKTNMAKGLMEFLNTASREELLELKGIGEKRAADILSLRKETPEPLKEIEDLEKIGISKKQAQSLFKGTARHILFS